MLEGFPGVYLSASQAGSPQHIHTFTDASPSMRLKPAVKFIACTTLIAAILTLLAALLLKRTTPIQLADTGTIVAIILCALGALMARGARIGDGPVVNDMTSSTSTTPVHVRWADNDNVLAGMHQGALMIVAGLVWLGLVALAYRVFT